VATLAPIATAPVERLHETWEARPGLYGILGTVDHKTIGKRYLVTALIFLVLGGIEALVMRVQLTHSNHSDERARGCVRDCIRERRAVGAIAWRGIDQSLRGHGDLGVVSAETRSVGE